MEAPKEERKPRNLLQRVLLNRWVLIGAVVLLIYTLAGFFLVPYVGKRYAEGFAAKDLKRDLTIRKVRFNPYTFRLETEGLEFKEHDGNPILGFERLVVDFELSSIYHRAWTFAEIGLTGPALNFRIAKDGISNLARLAGDFPSSGTAPPKTAEKGPPPRLIFQKIYVKDGTVQFADLRGREPAELKISPLSIELSNINTLPEHEGPYTITAATPAGETVRWTGEASLQPVRSQGSLEISALKVATLWKFFRDRLQVNEPPGQIGIRTDYLFDLSSADPQINLKGLRLELDGFGLTCSGEATPLLSLPKLVVEGGNLDLGARTLGIEKVDISGGRAKAEVDQAGNLDWSRLAAVDEAGTGEERAPEQAGEAAAAAGPPWKIHVDHCGLADIEILYKDGSRKTPFEGTVGSLGLSLKAAVEAGGGNLQAVAEDLSVDVSDLRLQLQGRTDPLLAVGAVQLDGGRFDLAGRKMTLQRVTLTKGGTEVVLEKNGGLNWEALTSGEEKGALKKGVEAAAQEARAQGQPWQVEASAVDLQDFALRFRDEGPKPPFNLTLQRVDLKLRDVSTDPKRPIPFDLAVKIAEGGLMDAKGVARPFEESAQVDLKVAGFSLIPFQPYLDRLARIKTASGKVGLKGRVVFGRKGTKTELSLKGDSEIEGLSLLDAATKEPLIGWDKFIVSKMDLSLSPDHLRVKEVRMLKPFGKVIIGEDHRLNLSELAVKDEKAATPQEGGGKEGQPGAVFPISVGRIRIQDGTLEYGDLSLEPKFRTLIHNLGGLVTGISTAKDSSASVDLGGRVDEYGEVKISGEISPFDPKKSTEMAMIFKNVEMTSLTPYSATFAGYRIDSGKLSLDLKYVIKDSQLLGQNQIVVDQLTLGEHVDRPGAANLPLKLAVALLKDADGRIDIGLPVHGNLDDPEFSYGHLIWKVLVNLITKAATAPFKFLGSLLGADSESFDRVDFPPGSATVPPPEMEKVDKLAGALKKRPQLTLQIQGTYDAAADGRVMKDALLRRAVAAAQGTKLESGEEPGSVVFHDPDAQGAIRKLFIKSHSEDAFKQLQDTFKEGLKKAEEEGKIPKDAEKQVLYAPFYKDLYGRLLEGTQLLPEALPNLAAGRAQAVREALVSKGGVEPGRVSLSPEVAVQGSDEKTVPTKLSLGTGS